MEFIRGLHNLKAHHHGCVASIGVFDGVHLGHQAIIRRLKREAAVHQLPTTVITFEPSPSEYFAKDAAPARLMRISEKLAMFEHYGVDRVLCLPFNEQMRNMPALAFIQAVLHDGLGVRFLVVGDDFRFGLGREGDIHLLRKEAERLGFAVERTESVLVDGERVSSTLIRHVLAQGDFKRAQALLGHPYRMVGRVAHGDKRGRTIGVHTANMALHRRVSPLRGVFAVKVYGIGDHVYTGVANVGVRPTVAGTQAQLEVHIFNFNNDIYGQTLAVEFVEKIRDEHTFDGLEQLKQQIMKDITAAKQILGTE